MSVFLDRISNLSPQRLALLAAELQARLEALEGQKSAPIAITGMACRFPGGADSPQAFWSLLSQGVDAIIETPVFKWENAAYFDPDPDAPGKVSTRWGGFLEGLDLFDPEFFGISPREANSLDPQQRLLLEVTWEALENAGRTAKEVMGSLTGVFVGISGSDFYQLMVEAGQAGIDAYLASGSAHSIASGRLSYFLGTQGPSISIDTACSSSLVAIHLAIQSLRNGDCDLALAGGVNVILTPEATISLSRSKMMAPDGRCKTFNARADGFVRGEGCGMLVLKPLSKALSDHDRVLAVIRGSAVNQDGRSNGLTAPNGPSQEAVLRSALANAGVESGEVSYIETHGTGTALGDPIEVQALGSVYCQDRTAALMLGSVKTNLGHLESAAGVAGVIKTVLALQHQEIPPHLNLQQRSPYIPWDEFPSIQIPTEPTTWNSAGDKLLAGVSSFGFSGTNVHVILEEAPTGDPVQSGVERPLHLFTLSARNPAALQELAGRYEQQLINTDQNTADICFTANAGRYHFAHRLAMVVESARAIQENLASFISGQAPASVLTGQMTSTRQPRVAFLFTGQGAQFAGMGRKLYETQPMFGKALDKCERLLRPFLERPLLEVLFAQTSASELIHTTAYTQPALFALEYALAELWQSWGIKPMAVLGHSVGEYVAACVAGVFSLEEGLKLIAERGRLMGALPPGGKMAAIFAPQDQVQAALSPYQDRVSVAAYNGIQHIVISGEGQAVTLVVEAMSKLGIQARYLNVSHAFHSPLMDSILDEFEMSARGVAFSEPRIDFLSNVTGTFSTSGQVARPAYWREHIRKPVRFIDSIAALYEKGYRHFIEIGPNPVLLGMARRSLSEDAGTWLPSLRQGRSDWLQLLESLATLYVGGVDVDWGGFDRDYAAQGQRRRISLPTYPFQRERYWITPGTDSKNNRFVPSANPVVHGLKDLLYDVAWIDKARSDRPVGELPTQTVTWLILSDQHGVGDELYKELTASGAHVVRAVAGEKFETISSGHYRINPMEPADFQRLVSVALPDSPNRLLGVIHLWALDQPSRDDMSVSDIERTQLLACGSLLHLTQALAGASMPEPPKLWTVTQGAQPINDPSGRLKPHRVAFTQAPVWGLSHVIAQEHPEFHCTRLDLDPQSSAVSQTQGLLSEILYPEVDEDQIAFRDQHRKLRRVVRIVDNDGSYASEVPIRADASYLITGGLGGLGLAVVGWLVAKGARNLMLMGRSAPSLQAQEAVHQMEAQGVQVVILRGDVSQPETLTSCLAAAGTITPPLRGIIHAAGTLDDGVLLHQTWERFQGVMASKISGSWNLHMATRDIPLDFCVYFSSGASVLGSPGQGTYAAANAFMDALAHHRSAIGLPTVSINWGAWSEVGMAAQQKEIISSKRGSLTPQEGFQALEWGIRTYPHSYLPLHIQLIVMKVDWSGYFHQLMPGQAPALLEAFWKEADPMGPAITRGGEDAPDTPTLLEALATIPPKKRFSTLVAQIRAQAALVLGIDPKKNIDLDLPLHELGLDSLMAVELRNKLSRLVGQPLPATLLFEFPTVRTLAGRLETVLFQTLASPEVEQEKPIKPPLIEQAPGTTDLDQMTEEELAALLIKKINTISRSLE